jgi:small subunit ribosomal protein S6
VGISPRELVSAHAATPQLPPPGAVAQSRVRSRESNRIVPATDYEVTYIIRPTLEDAEIEARIEQLSQLLQSNGGEVVGEIEKMGKRRLAYEIDDVREGYYVIMKFKSEPAAAKELERQMRLNEDVMRALLINLND